MEELDTPINIDDSRNLHEGINDPNNDKSSVFYTRFSLWMSILYSSAFEIIGSILAIAILFIAALTGFIEVLPDGTYDINSSETVMLLLIINILAAIILGTLVILFNKKVRFIETLPKEKPSRNHWLLALIGFSIMLFLIGGFDLIVSTIIDKFYPDFVVETPYDFFNSDNVGVIIIAMISVVVAAPIAEEIFYRWSMVSALRKGMNKTATILFSALIFAFAHSAVNLSISFFYFVIHFISTFILGIVFAWIFIRTNQLLLSIILHASWNFIISLSSVFSLLNLENVYSIIYLVLAIIGGIISITSFIIFLKRKRIFTKESRKETLKVQPIKIKGIWFELIGVYFLLIVLLPVIIQELTEAFSFGEGLIIISYYLILMIASSFLVMDKHREYLSSLTYNMEPIQINDKKIEEEMP